MNKYKRALEHLRSLERDDVFKCTNQFAPQINSDILQELVKKENPTIPEVEGDSVDDNGNAIYDTWICPYCHEYYEIDYDCYEYCPKCGQHIDTKYLEQYR